MPETRHTVGLFTTPQQFPCGVGSSCCGPIGQTEEEIAALKAVLERLGVDVEIHDIGDVNVARKHVNVARLLRCFGPGVVPILTVGDEVVCMGRSNIEEAVKAVEQTVLST